ncbi:hypothetical protein GM415_04250 [Pseudodesulfovibrio cashew]|uniref:Uncharacterized protein n=1 Tax=Pseudodesulfovibrio cashew TaxID=2678688 RepID=A0A6I6JFS0_9BACT|nr:hypothetical protein [Pseudodesulfovibrio cashew]QGY39363.1 hypothetical protein GM415_04250 [Pseudodesulfovibrio cashew]
MRVYTHFKSRYGRWQALLRLLFYPVIGLVVTPVQLVRSLWNCRELANGKWGDYGPQFNASFSINNLWYYTVALNFYRFGRNGRSPQLGLGDYPMSMLYAYSLPSLYAMWQMGCVAALLGMFGWLLAHAVWFGVVGWSWALLVIGLAFISSYFYVNTFGRQNYNALGWMLFPLGLFAIQQGQWWLAGAAWLAVSFGSSLATIMAGLLSLVLAVWTRDPMPLYAMVPATLKIGMHLWPSFQRLGVRGALGPMIKIMGSFQQKARYTRLPKGTWLQLDAGEFYYNTLIYSQLLFFVWLTTGEFSPLLFGGILIFIGNSTVFRLHDIQTMYMMMMSLGVMTVMAHPIPELLIPYWLFMSPLPYFVNMPNEARTLDVMQVGRPVNIRNELDAADRFFDPVSKGQRIIIAYDDPRGLFSNIFDGYRFQIELFLYAGGLKGIHLMPDWFGIYESNYEGGAEYWGRDLESVSGNIERWSADFALVYQPAGQELDPQWEEAGFSCEGVFRWGDYPVLNREWLTIAPTVDWWLLRAPASLSA